MPCHSAMVEHVLIAKPDETVEDVLAKLRKKKDCHTIVVLDENSALLGYVDMKVLLKNLLPVSVEVGSGTPVADIKTVGAAPGIAKRLRKVKPLPVHAIMEREFETLPPDAAIWVGVQALVEHGSPVFVVEEESRKFAGLINEESTINELERIQDEQGGIEKNAISGT
ncbi:MAG: HPP family protein [Alphaproteobacteria bacterium]